jgi:hypothetical protein
MSRLGGLETEFVGLSDGTHTVVADIDDIELGVADHIVVVILDENMDVVDSLGHSLDTVLVMVLHSLERMTDMRDTLQLADTVTVNSPDTGLAGTERPAAVSADPFALSARTRFSRFPDDSAAPIPECVSDPSRPLP